MSRGTIFRFRISEEDYADLVRRSEKAGLTKADVIRRALHWPLSRPTQPEDGHVREEPLSGEPGTTALEQLQQRRGIG